MSLQLFALLSIGTRPSFGGWQKHTSIHAQTQEGVYLVGNDVQVGGSSKSKIQMNARTQKVCKFARTEKNRIVIMFSHHRSQKGLKIQVLFFNSQIEIKKKKKTGVSDLNESTTEL